MHNTNLAIRLPLLIVALACALAIWQRQSAAPIAWTIQWPTAVDNSADAPLFSSELVSDAVDRFVHAASVTELDDGRLFSVWFSGSREGARDVAILGAYYDPISQRWGEDQVLATRPGTQQDVGRFIRKLGNPVVTQAPDGKLWLFYVSVSVGGWAGSAINARYSEDGGTTWSATERLISSPFFNISTLIKGTPYYYSDGTIGLPVYHEFMGKFSELLRLDADGKVLDKIRITHGKHSLQPVILPASSNTATALMRFAGAPPKRMLVSHSDDGGEHWQRAYKNHVPNPNSALSAVRLGNGDIIGVMNDLDKDRYRLSLLRSSDDGENWEHLYLLEGSPAHDGENLPRPSYTAQLEQDLLASTSTDSESLWGRFSGHLDKRVCKSAGCRFSYDYPYMIQDANGDLHIVYTWNKSFIKHLRFNQAWLDSL
jgi:predicted neuraminidase